MSKLTRRQLLVFFGASAGTAVLAPALGEKYFGSNKSLAQTADPLKFTPVRLPHPLPLYTEQKSFYATGIGKGRVLSPTPGAKLSEFKVIDDVVVPPEYERYVTVSWGDRVFANEQEYFGYNSDYTSFVPVDGRNPNDGYLVETSNLIGIFGNNLLFFIPTTGPDAGTIIPFAYDPMRCEMTGPTFVGDTLIISVQHPSEEVPFTPEKILSRDIEILNLEGSDVFYQKRILPRGSNWPSNIEKNAPRLNPPRPSVIGIRRKR